MSIPPLVTAGDIAIFADTSGQVIKDSNVLLGTIATGQFVDGLFIDARGTGSADDTAIWTAALADAATLGYNKIYAKKPSAVRNLIISAPIEIIGVAGFTFSLTSAGIAVATGSISGTTMTITAVASGTIAVGQSVGSMVDNAIPSGVTIASLGTGSGGIGTYILSKDAGTIPSETLTMTGNDFVMQIASDNVILRDMTISLPPFSYVNYNFKPNGAYGIYCLSPSSGIPYKNILLDNILITGGHTAAFNFQGADHLTIRNCESRYSGHGLILGARPTRRVIVQGFTGISCNGYAIAMANILRTDDPPSYTDPALSGVTITYAKAINCGKLTFYNGFDGNPGGGKGGYDLTSNSATGLYFRGEAVGCAATALEIKFTLPPPTGIAPTQMRDVDVEIFSRDDVGIGNATVIITSAQGATPDTLKRVRVKPTLFYAGPQAFVNNHFYEVGDAVTVAGSVYLCCGDANNVAGYSGGSAGPSGTGTGIGSYSDGNLKWAFFNNTDSGVPSNKQWAISCGPCGDTVSTILIDNPVITGYNYGIILITGTPTGGAVGINNLVIRNPVIRSCNNGIVDDGNPFLNVAQSLQFDVIGADVESIAGPALQLGSSGNGTSTGPTTCNCTVVGGRFAATGGQALLLNGGTVNLHIDGGARFIAKSNNFGAAYVNSTCVAAVICYSAATFQNAGTGKPCIQFTGTGSWVNNGDIITINNDDTSYGILSADPTQFLGYVCRGVKTGIPTTAGQLNEYWKLSPPVQTPQQTAATPTIIQVARSAYFCTTAGAAGAAVWTPNN